MSTISGSGCNIPWDDTHSEIIRITESLRSIAISRATNHDLATIDSDSGSENSQPEGLLALLKPEKDSSKRTYLLKKAPPTDFPPRQDIKRIVDGGNDMASPSILQDSLKYYEKARRTYENNVQTRERLLAINAPTSQAIVNKGDGPEKSEDLLLDYIQQILKHINTLLSKQNYDYDSSWGSMVDELDLDEGFFVTNISKTHSYGELYEFLVATRLALGEYRLMESYYIWLTEKLAKFGEERLGKYMELRNKTNWTEVWREIGEERKLLAEYVKEFEEYYQDIAEMRVMKSYGHAVETFLPPRKPYTPYIDDIISASHDTGITHEYFAKEVLFLAEEMATGENFISHCIRARDLNYLALRFDVDLGALRIVFNGHPNPKTYFFVKDRIEKLLKLFFVKEGSDRYIPRDTWSIAGMKLLDILEDEDEEFRSELLKFFLDDPKSLPGLEDVDFGSESENSEVSEYSVEESEFYEQEHGSLKLHPPS
ncbi:hypothetical protein TWF506_005525 [Arthrobotrys conoides]|uniref:Uncharacterized protein n=1 Tax=Arthrobotrys conoides TaxID=74498 RepID=A0AAN8RWW8_9PEZI